MNRSWINELKEYRYTSGFFVNLLVLGAIYKLFGFEWLMVVALADITRDLGVIVMKLFSKPTTGEDGKELIK